ncbi:PhzF family phenazine biosynthesis protein [Rhodobium orientis]|uniref:Phenazine biosynthesis protein PhzF family n=1 Tax=Rhodobium orientis TaxID=34017 RepID=A0A327JFR5_9HYPH|nr:PhzF family phenazine biosynthesis protein [Rhodobium orientis]MBB4301585.1 PhzF family phenazine biosynthesis protein [Rhodobium orientis]MBK5952280.1 phenazine biosynthesis protein PhzF family [Rhodobium orientis]RAI24771.1 phenazine biosynthesis protein PhzF family [Rhodobium orientis]
MEMFQVDAFTDRVFGGNPAAVLILDRWLSDAVLQAIAGENNLAETAFACRGKDGWHLRWFTPTVEVDFCGHATLATAHVLAREHGVAGEMRFATRVGELRVTATEDGYALDVPLLAPEPLERLPEEVAHLVPAGAILFRNFENFFAELADEDAVTGFSPDLSAIAKLGPVGLVVTATGTTTDFVSRYFAPGAGIPEDPVTGSTHATLAPYWATRLGKARMTARQASARGGSLTCEIAGERVRLYGQAVTFMKADIRLPD